MPKKFNSPLHEALRCGIIRYFRSLSPSKDFSVDMSSSSRGRVSSGALKVASGHGFLALVFL
ncbi:MAG: hypothetical protein KKE81_00215, partial [Candidatus Omnitrophica bacterium]|nr:hypothetical protein [Candidatus Omnitrophota bacterium]